MISHFQAHKWNSMFLSCHLLSHLGEYSCIPSNRREKHQEFFYASAYGMKAIIDSSGMSWVELCPPGPLPKNRLESKPLVPQKVTLFGDSFLHR